MAVANDIPTDLALEIGDDIDPRRFLAAAREFFAFVERTGPVADATTRLEWRVKVQRGSNILALDPAPSMLKADAVAAYGRVERGVRALVSNNFSAGALDDAALEHARKLSDIGKTQNGTVPIRIWIRREPISFGPDVGDFIREETKSTYWDYGSIEGALNAIQDGKGGLELRVRDPLWQRAIKCLLPEDMLAEAMNLFRQRVELFGEIHYRKDDTPDAIKVNRLERLPNDDDLPSIEDVRGLLSGDAALG